MLNNLSAFFATISTGEIAFLVECALAFVLFVVLIQLYVSKIRKDNQKNQFQYEIVSDATSNVEIMGRATRTVYEDDFMFSQPAFILTANDRPVPDFDVEPMFAPVRDPGPEFIAEVSVEFLDSDSNVGVTPLIGN